jgi:hypothetical protein
MKALRDVEASELLLRKPSWKSGEHELLTGEELVGRLDVSSWSSWPR